MSNAVSTLVKTPIVARFAERFAMNPDDVVDVLRATAFKVRDGQATDAQMSALMIVADQYKLNPFTKEIYAYPDKQNGIVPVVGVDGWSRIINEHPALDGIEFNYAENVSQHKGKKVHEWIECVIYRKDRTRPTTIREDFDEVVRNANFSTPWDTHPKRMHRHKALIQCARIAFGFAGLYDEDEAQRILEVRGLDNAAAAPTIKHMGAADVVVKAPAAPPPENTLPAFPQEDFDKGLPVWKKAAAKLPVAEVLARAEAANPGFAFTEPQKAAILSLKPAGDAKDDGLSEKSVESHLDAANTREALDQAGNEIELVKDPEARKRLSAKYDEREKSLKTEG